MVRDSIRLQSISLVAVIIITAAGIFGCNSQEPTQPADQEPAQSADEESTPAQPTEAWVADGIINSGEYSGSAEFGNFSLYWRSDNEYAYFGMKAETTGFVALGIQPGNAMKDADIIFGYVEDGNAVVVDLFSTGAFGPHSEDTELGGVNNVTEFAGTENDGITVIEFKRALNTADEYDIPLKKGINKIIWSYGSSDSMDRKHSNRGYGEINLQ